jgi:DNA-binding transcriptional LysR family regulator
MTMNFRQLDLNLLRVLCAVYRSGSVTAAGRQLALSQPATSNALARLRRCFDDALFVPSPSGLHPTRLAQRIAPVAMAHLRELEAALSSSESFDPALAQEHWRLSLSDLGEMMFLPQLAQSLRQDAPHCQLSNVAVDAGRVSAALEAMDIDLAIGILQPERPERPEQRGIVSVSLFQEHYVAITGSRWRPAGGGGGKGLSPAQLAAASLAVAAPTATFHGSVEQMLTRLALNDRAVLRVRHYGAMPEIVTCTDLMAIVPQRFAESLAPRYAVRVWELPSPAPLYDVRMVWHQSASAAPAQAWLRGRVRELFARQAPGVTGNG